jgi:hypothetical protein
LLVLDPLISRLEGKLDTHKSQKVRLALEPLQEMLDRTLTACIGLIHVSKRADTDPLTLFVAARAFAEVARAAVFNMADPDSSDTKVIGQVKNNYGPGDLPAMQYHIDGVTVAETEEGTVSAGKLFWDNLRSESIRELLEAAKETGEVRTATREAKDWLEDYLHSVGGKASSNDVKQAGKKAGHTESTLKRARRKLRVQVESEGFPRMTYWILPSEFIIAKGQQ